MGSRNLTLAFSGIMTHDRLDLADLASYHDIPTANHCLSKPDHEATETEYGRARRGSYRIVCNSRTSFETLAASAHLNKEGADHLNNEHRTFSPNRSGGDASDLQRRSQASV